MKVGQRAERTLFEGGGTDGAWGQDICLFGDLDVTGTGAREDRSGQTRKRECGRDTWNADIPNRKMVLNHALFAFITRGGTVWSLLSLCIFIVVLNKIKSLDHSSRFMPLQNFSGHMKGIVSRGLGMTP